MTPDTPTAWSVYIGTNDVEALAKRVQSAGGTVVAPPFDVGDQGKMAVFQDPSGAFISAWQGSRMGGFQTDAPNSFGWAELNARGIEKAIPFYTSVFGWTTRTSEMGEGATPVHRVPAGRRERRRRLGDEPDGPGRGAQLLAGLLRGR